MATVRRLGLIAFRIAMLLRSLRILESGDMTPPMICQDNDFNSALQIIRTLVKHASKVFSDLPEDTPLVKKKNQRELFLEKLPQLFNRQGYLKVAKSLDIAEKTAEGYISKFVNGGLVYRLKQDSYEKYKVLDL
jgi:Fic family protein